MIDPTMGVTLEEQERIYEGVKDGNISKDAEKAILDYMEVAHQKGLPKLEFKRQLRDKVTSEQGVPIAAAIDKLWTPAK